MAMKSIRHTSQNQLDWFCRQGDFLKNRAPLWIIRQERFDEDLASLSRRIGVDLQGPAASEPDAPTTKYTNEYSGVSELFSKTRENLSRWYAQDVEFYSQCERWIEDRLSQ